MKLQFLLPQSRGMRMTASRSLKIISQHWRAFSDIARSYTLKTYLEAARARCIFVKTQMSVKRRDCKAKAKMLYKTLRKLLHSIFIPYFCFSFPLPVAPIHLSIHWVRPVCLSTNLQLSAKDLFISLLHLGLFLHLGYQEHSKTNNSSDSQNWSYCFKSESKEMGADEVQRTHLKAV